VVLVEWRQPGQANVRRLCVRNPKEPLDGTVDWPRDGSIVEFHNRRVRTSSESGCSKDSDCEHDESEAPLDRVHGVDSSWKSENCQRAFEFL